MKKLLCFFAFSVVFFSCRSVKLQPLRTQTTTSIKDSTASRTVQRDTLLVFPKDSVSLAAKFLELTSRPITKTSQRGDVSVSLRRIGETVEARCDTEHLERIIALQDKVIEQYQRIETLTKEETTIETTKMPGWAKIPVYVGCIVILLAFVGLFMYIRSMPKRMLKQVIK